MCATGDQVNILYDDKKIVIRMFLVLIVFEVFFVLLDAFVNYGKFTEISALRKMANIAREDGMATWFAVTQTFLAGLTALAVYYLSRRINMVQSAVGWLVISCFFIYMAIDDAAQVHERLGTAFNIISKRGDDGVLSALLSLSPSYTWQLVVGPIFVGIGLYMSYFLWRELKASGSRKLIILAVVWMGIAVGLDFFEGLEREHRWNIYTYLAETYALKDYTVWHFAKVAEEFLEMLSITTFWIIFSKHLFFLISPLELSIKARKEEVGNTDATLT